MEELAVDGGKPISEKTIPIAGPIIAGNVVEEISEILRSGILCQGPKTRQFEDEFAETVGSEYAYAVNSGTAALHVAQMSILEPGDEVIVPDLTFFATASIVVLAGGRPVFADIDEKTLTIKLEDVVEKKQQRQRQ